jgi:L-threonylcarbamoyladenylate synthase
MNNIEEAVKILLAGGVVAYPTDTAYGFAVDATNIKAIKKLYELKGRENKPIAVVCPSIKDASKIVNFNGTAKKLASEYWPGGLTLVLPLKAVGKNWDLLSAKTHALGIRCPDNSISIQLVERLQAPITATSANISGQPTTYSIKEIQKQFAKSKLKPDYYLDGGKLQTHDISTMLHIEGKHVTLIREGVVPYHNILKILT